jgi:hypothetical protein
MYFALVYSFDNKLKMVCLSPNEATSRRGYSPDDVIKDFYVPKDWGMRTHLGNGRVEEIIKTFFMNLSGVGFGGVCSAPQK